MGQRPVVSLAQRLAYVALGLWLFVHARWLAAKRLADGKLERGLAWARAARLWASRPAASLETALAAARRKSRGQSPKPPRALGVVVLGERSWDETRGRGGGTGARDGAGEAAAGSRGASRELLEATTRILAWAAQGGFEVAVLYDPSGALRALGPALQRQVTLRALPTGIRITTGWGEGGEGDAESEGGLEGEAEGVGGEGGDGRAEGGWDGCRTSPGPGAQRHLQAFLLDASDAAAPSRAAAERAARSAGSDDLGASSAGLTAHEARERADEDGDPTSAQRGGLETALAAPSALERRLCDASTSVAGLQPDLLVVFGAFVSTAGFPPWMLRCSEVFLGGDVRTASGSRMESILQRFLQTRQRNGA